MKLSGHKVRGAVIVTRVSTGEQAKHGTSLASQLEMCRSKALSLNVPVVAEYEDAGISGGFLLLRTGMQSALADIQEGRADTLICANISRYSRDVEHQQAIRKTVRQAGGYVHFCDMDFEDTPEGDFAFTVMGGMAEYERKRIRALTMRGKRKRAEDGQQPQRSRSPYGYHIVRNAEVECGLYPPEMRGRYVIDEEKAQVARRLFVGYAGGSESLPSLCKKLNAEGVPAPSGGNWHEPTVRVILTNPVYKGDAVSGRHACSMDEGRLRQVHALTGMPITSPLVRRLVPEGERLTLSAPPLVSAETWEAVQKRLETMQVSHGGNPKRAHMLSGLCVCPLCGVRAVIKYQKAGGKTYSYYWCSTRKKSRNLPGERPCQGDLYPLAVVEEATIQAVREAYQHPAALSAALRVYRKRQRPAQSAAETRREIESLEAELKAVRSEEGLAVQAQIAGIRAGASADAYTAVFAQIAARRSDLEGRIASLRGALSAPAGRERGRGDQALMKSALEDAATALADEYVAGAEKRAVLGTVVEKVLPHKEGADVVFVRSLLKAVTDEDDAGEQGACDTFHTICMGIRTQR
jgi:site-specific DNA recombinase